MLLLLTGLSFAGDNPASSQFAPSFKDYLDLSSSANPDLPCFQMHFAGLKANAMFGSEIGVFGSFSDGFKYMLTIAPFLNLYDYSQSLIPYMLWRGSFGINNYFEFSGLSLSRDNRFIIKLGVVHESDHYTGGEGNNYWETFNINFSHMNYVNMGIILVNELPGKEAVLVWNAGYKYNFNNLLNLSEGARPGRNPLHYIYAEGALYVKSAKNTDFYISVYLERIYNSPALSGEYSTYVEILSATESDYLYLNLGLKYKGAPGIIYQPFLIYSVSSGRGVDYTILENAIGLGLRIII